TRQSLRGANHPVPWFESRRDSEDQPRLDVPPGQAVFGAGAAAPPLGWRSKLEGLLPASARLTNTPSSGRRERWCGGPATPSAYRRDTMPAVELLMVEALAQRIRDKQLEGAVVEPIPRSQTQEGPNCGFYALSIVLDYWKAVGKTATSYPARKRDVDLQGRDE